MSWIKQGESFAVKLIRRENSIQDLAHLQNVFVEITCLELLIGNVGVCQIRDFGTTHTDYTIQMECGRGNLSDWRRNIFPGTFTSCEDVALLLLIYLDILYILKSVHDKDIIHFDIKCCNFILRYDFLSQCDLKKIMTNQAPSGLLFLCDFGESLYGLNRIQIQDTAALEDLASHSFMRSRGIYFPSPPLSLFLIFCCNDILNIFILGFYSRNFVYSKS